jgi:hypothetical protein
MKRTNGIGHMEDHKKIADSTVRFAIVQLKDTEVVAIVSTICTSA